jgi:hypothetical protein
MTENDHSPPLPEPEIATYVKSELTIKTEYIATGSFDSSRRFKLDFARVDTRSVLRSLLA